MMKFSPFLKFTQASILAAITIATATAINITPSNAAQPTRIIQAPGKPELVIYGNSQSFEIGCPSVRNLWQGLRTEQLNLPEYQNIRVTGKLACNAPTSQVIGYTSLAFEQYGYVGVLTLQGVPYLVRNKEVYQALGITPLVDNNGGGGFYLATQQKTLRDNTVFEVQSSLPPAPILPEIAPIGSIFPVPPRPPIAPPVNPPATPVAPPVTPPVNPPATPVAPPATPIVPPVTPPADFQRGSVTFFNRGAYVARYTLSYDTSAGTRTVESGDVTVGKKVIFTIPVKVSNPRVEGRLFTGLFNQTKPIFSTSLNPASNSCFATTGNVFNARVERCN